MSQIRYLTAGESHGPQLTVIVEGLPAGAEVTVPNLAAQLARRRKGVGAGARMAIETDEIAIVGGVRHGRTLGSPVAVTIGNAEYAEKWSERMSPAPGADPGPAVTRPRPGHADLVGMVKYNHDDARNVLERASARETAARTVAGALANAVLEPLGIRTVGWVSRIGSEAINEPRVFEPADVDAIESSEVRCPDADVSQRMIEAIGVAKSAGDTLGGVIEVAIHNLPVGLGSHVHWDRKLDTRLAAAVMSVQAMKAVWFGAGIRLASIPGSDAHDEINWTSGSGWGRDSNNAGGLEGGSTTGMPLHIGVAMKPIATLRKPLNSVDAATHEPAPAAFERSDVCAVPRAVPIIEAVAAFEIADAVLEKFGGDSMFEIQDRVDAWRKHSAQF